MIRRRYRIANILKHKEMLLNNRGSISKFSHRSVPFLFLVFLLATCIEPYKPKLEEYNSLLVVEGMITNANTSNTIRLSRSFQNENTSQTAINDASVSISDDGGSIFMLKSKGNGIYKTDSLLFTGVVGRTYVLHITTIEDEEYESSPVLMQPVPEIDSIYFKKDQKLINNNSETCEGITIYLDSKTGDRGKYYRWSYDETWKFRVPYPKVFDYVHTADPDLPRFDQLKDPKETCWKKSKSDGIFLRSVRDDESGMIEKQPVCFIASGESDRLMVQYSILVKQYSISKDEFEFWNNLKKVNNAGSDIFARVPFSVTSNIHCITNPGAKVLGFFQVSAISQKRKNISFNEIAPLGLPFYSYSCRTWQFDPKFFDTPCMCPPKTWDDVYWYLCIVSNYTFIRPIYSGRKLIYLEFTRPECGDCELTGSHTEPDFWHEIKW